MRKLHVPTSTHQHTKDINTTKQSLHALCLNFVQQRIAGAETAIKESQRSANEETKSSSGDKYETGRAMAQLEIEKNSVQLAEAKKMLQILSLIKTDVLTSMVQSGSIVTTDQGNFYISIAAGKLSVEQQDYFAISPASPIAMSMWNKKNGESFSFNKKNYLIISIE